MSLPSLSAHPDYDPAIPAKPAAKYCGMHYKTILDLTHRGKLPVIRSAGGRLSYRLSALNKYLDSLTEEPRKARPAPEIDWGA